MSLLSDFIRFISSKNGINDKSELLTMILKSNPKAYNIDKILDFLSQDGSVFLFYFIGFDTTKITDTILVSMFQENLLNATITLKHWAGRNSRGVTQFEGKAIEEPIT